MDWQHRDRSEAVRDAFVEKDEGDPDLPAHRKSSGQQCSHVFAPQPVISRELLLSTVADRVAVIVAK
jgi:hypothetical protein